MLVESEINKNEFVEEVSKITQSNPIAKLQFFNENSVKVDRSATRLIENLDFKKLTDIHDHEEAFLYRNFYRGLAQAFVARIAEGSVVIRITKQDVRSAMIAVGAAAQVAPVDDFAANSKIALVSVCPYCV